MPKFIVPTLSSDDEEDIKNPQKNNNNLNLSKKIKKRKVEEEQQQPLQENDPSSEEESEISSSEDEISQVDFEEKEITVSPWDLSNTIRAAIPTDQDKTIDQKIKNQLQKKKEMIQSDDSDSDRDDDDSFQDDSEDDDSSQDKHSQDESSDSVEQTPSQSLQKDQLIPLKQLKPKVQNIPTPAKPTNTTFQSLSLSKPILKILSKLNYATPTPIQSQAVPYIIKGHDVFGSAETGSGKSLAFMLPMVDHLLKKDKSIFGTRAVILEPTRELAAQAHAVLEKLTSVLGLRICLLIGGLPLRTQEAQLRQHPDVVIGTPGRVIDHLRNSPTFGLDNLEILILDEADRLLDVGFTKEVNEIIKVCPKSRQTLLFSATLTEGVDDLVKVALNRPVRIIVDALNHVAKSLDQEFIKIKTDSTREASLLYLCKHSVHSHCIIFFKTKKQAHRMKIIFGLSGLDAVELHGDLTQSQRLEALENFRTGKAHFLLATDVAARGLDILGVTTVINFTLPSVSKDYIHRVGRTARAGHKGKAISLAGRDDRALVKEVVKNGQSKVTQRILSQDGVLKAKEEIDQFEKDITEILQEEAVETAIRKGEQEVQKGINMEVYADEIQRRPRRTWFLTQDQKKEIQQLSKLDRMGVDPNESNKEDKKLNAIELRKQKRDEALKKHHEKVKKRDNAIQTVHAKALKKQQREKQKTLDELPSYLEDEFADKPKKKKKAHNKKGKSSSAEPEKLYQQEKVQKKKHRAPPPSKRVAQKSPQKKGRKKRH